MGKLLESSDAGLRLEGIAYVGLAVITVWWADGRVTHTTYASRRHCYAAVGGEAHPFNRWEIRAK